MMKIEYRWAIAAALILAMWTFNGRTGAQGNGGTIVGVPFGTSIPINCNPVGPGQQNPLFYLTTTQGSHAPGFKFCRSLNSWADSVSVIAAGTAAMGTSAIGSGACATTVTATATGVLSTDNVLADFNADPTSTTGYAPGGSGILTIVKFPTASAVNFDVCNNTSGTITPGAITLNWRVLR